MNEIIPANRLPKRMLYVNYGPQSGVIESVTERLRGLGEKVEHFDVSKEFLYKSVWRGWQIPNLRWDVAVASAEAIRRHGRQWRHYYYHSTFAFDRMSARVAAAIERLRPDLVLQAGALFAPPAAFPYYLYLDHTRAIAERYASVPGELEPIPADPAWRSRETSAYRNAQGIFVMSNFVRRSLIDEYGVGQERVHVVGAGPNVESGPDFEPPADRGRTFLFVGLRWIPKGGPMLLDAFARVRKRHPDAQLWAITAQPPAQVPEGVRFIAPMPVSRLAEWYARASYFVLPTTREAFGLAFLEAMSFGLPCIGPAIEAIPEIIDDGRTGRLVAPRHLGSLTVAMLELLEQPARARELGLAGQRKVRRGFSWQLTAERMLAVLAPAAARSPAVEAPPPTTSRTEEARA